MCVFHFSAKVHIIFGTANFLNKEKKGGDLS